MRLAIAASAMGMAALFALEAGADPWPARAASPPLASFHRVVAAEPYVPREVGLFAAAGFGYDRGVLCTSDTHARAAGSLAASVGVQSWLALTVRLDGRHDRHTCVATSADSSSVAAPRLMLSARGSLSRAWHAGGHVRLLLPSARGLSAQLDAATVDALAALSYAPPAARMRVAANVGMRLDRSARLVGDAGALSRARLLGLGASDANAVVVGVAAAYRLGPVDVVGEWTWDWLVGEDAPDVSGSPMRLAAGVRVPVGSRWLAQVMVETQLAEPPRLWPDDPLVPFEPAVSLTAGLHYRFRLPKISWLARPAREPATGQAGATPASPGSDATDSSTRPAPPAPRPEPPREPAPEPPDPEPPVPEPPPEPPEPAVVTGRVTGDDGAPVVHAQVTLELADEPRQTFTDAQGLFRFDEVPVGPVDITVSAPDYESGARDLDLEAGQTHEVEFTLEPALPPAQLRGLVRSFRGEPLVATLTVEPAGPRAGARPARQATTGADGAFQLDVEPGRYVVVIRADGYRAQRRRVTVEEGGVTILNVDMRRGR